MKNTKIILLLVLFCGIIFSQETPKLKIVATTTNISSIVREIVKDKAEIIEIIPYGMCPGHFDLSVKDAQKIIEADLFIYHGWEVWIKNFLDKTKKSYKISTLGNLMLPDVNISVSKEIFKVLCSVDFKNKDFYEKNYNEYCKKIIVFQKQIKQKFRKYKGIKVICCQHQRDFLEWLGFEILYSYPRQEQVSLRDFKNMFFLNQKIAFIADNLQSGPDTAKQLAEDLNIKHIVLTNFVEDTYINTLNRNIKKIEEVLK